MIPTPGKMAERRRQLSEDIALQRLELSVAYRGLIKPFQYADTAVAGMKVLRKNGWIIGLAPSFVSLVFSFLGWEKKSQPSLLQRVLRKTPISGAAKAEDEAKALPKLRKPLGRLAGHAWGLFQVYRKVRPFFP